MEGLPFLGHGPIAQDFAEQCQDFGYLYDRGQSVAWVKSRWSVGDKGDLLLKAAIGDHCTNLYLKYPPKTPRRAHLLDSRFRQGVLTEAKPLLPKWKFSEQFDQDPYLLGVPGNGVVDLRTGQLRDMRRDDYCTKRTHVRPDSSEPKLFLKFLDEITGKDTELRSYLLRFAGYTLTGRTSEHCLPFWWGTGANGKGTLLNVLQYILGFDYSTVVRMADLTRRDTGNDNQRRILAKLCGARLVTCNEGNHDIQLDMALLKTLASSDMLSGAHLYENEFSFVPSHKLVIATNAKPVLETDAAARRRVHLVPFTVSFRGRENKELEEQLKGEASGILGLLIRYCAEWRRIGLSPPKSVTQATDELFKQLDVIGRFMEERLQRDPSAFTFTSDLGKAFQNFLVANGEVMHWDERKLMGEIKERGCYEAGKKRTEQGPQRRGLWGVRVKDAE
jgi:P4 family phage/plasmid primase-like protien